MSVTRLQSSRSGRGPLASPAVRKRLDASIRRLKLPRARLLGLDPMPLRVGFVGEQGFTRMGGAVDALRVRPDWVGSLVARAGSSLDLLLVDPAPHGFERGTVAALISEARALGARVVGLREGEYLAIWEGAVDLELDLGPPTQPEPSVASRLPFGPRPASHFGTRRLSLAAPVNPTEVNPIGFRWETDRRLAAVGTLDLGRPGGEAAYRRLADAAGWATVDLFRAGGPLTQSLPDGVEDVSGEHLDGRERRERLRDYRGVVDHAGLHASAHEHANRIVELSASGAPVLLRQMSAGKRALLGDQLAAALEPISLETLEDPGERERASVIARRAALREHSLEAAWRRVAEEAGVAVPRGRLLSVIVATNRPSHLEHVVAQVSHQSYRPRELVLVLHGDQFPADVEGRLEQLVESAMTVVRVSSEATLGDALNAGTEAASGEVITKMDDDDWYGPEHLWDLVLALEYSGAELVAKGAEFVYLDQLDLTIRRFVGRGESSNRTVGGGTLTISRRNLEALGGWRPLAHGVDIWLLADVERAGGRLFRTHGFGYIYRRHGAQTWAKGVDYFLRQSKGQWRGLDLDAAAARWPASTPAAGSDSARIVHPWQEGIPAQTRSRPPLAAGAEPRSSPAAPRFLSELRLAMLAGSKHAGHIAHVCDATDAGRGGWRAKLESSRPHLLLIESSWLRGYVEFGYEGGPPPTRPERVQRAHEVIAWCRDNEVPTALWETSPWSAIVTPLALMEEVRYLFCADPDAAVQLARELEGRRPLELPLAAQVIPSTLTPFEDRAAKVAFLWPWNTGSRDDRSERMDEIFDIAAPHGIVILDPISNGSEAPRRMRHLVTPVDGYRGALAASQKYRIVVALDTRVGGTRMVPQVIFDLAAGGNVVMVPRHIGASRQFRFLVVSAKSRRHIAAEIDRLLTNSRDWGLISRDSRNAVRNAERYANRIASVASVAGLSVLPKPTSPPPRTSSA